MYIYIYFLKNNLFNVIIHVDSMREKYSREIFRKISREVKDYNARTAIIYNLRRLPLSLSFFFLSLFLFLSLPLSHEVHFSNLQTPSRRQSVHCHRARATYACEIASFARVLIVCADRLRNRLSLRRKGRITDQHWLPLFVPHPASPTRPSVSGQK